MGIMRTVLAVALAALLAAGALAQSKPPTPPAKPGQQDQGPGNFRRMTPEERLKRFSEQLKLTPAQQKQVKAIWEKRSQKMQGMRSQFEKMTPDQRMKAMDKLRKESSDAVRKILTPTQQKAYDKMLKEEEARRKEFMQRRGQGGRPGTGSSGQRGSTGGSKGGG